ncbi:apolipoprotein L3-like [Peromyscus leucopus]|uniref:apolipoprotein L3-like n=1 Tax=Peromyscus leucopus TaxID=10041 RepID=UPI0018854BE5|nr:apolipoprotein L3-like [Peromyscus leucopus]XP_037053523.1 apolipoprotein L3-like [Peromyscus leucopus]
MAASREPDGHNMEEFTDLLTQTLSREVLKHLITEDETWEAFVEAAELSSEQEGAVRDALNEHLAQEPTDEDDETQRELQKKRFLEEFPELKRNLEGHIRKLRDLADHLDKVHRDCTISNVVADSTGISSAVLGILGIVLAPFTGGASVLLTGPSLGLGAVAAVTGITTSIVEESNKGSDEAEAEKVVNAIMDTLHDILMIIPKISVKTAKSPKQLLLVIKLVAGICRSFCSFRIASAIRLARGLNLARGLSATRGLRAAGAGLNFLLFGIDIYNLVNNSKDLNDGAKTKRAGEFRDLAKSVEEKLQEFEQIHIALQSDLFQ